METNKFIPGGSYIKTSREISIEISAECQKIDTRTYQKSSLTYNVQQASGFPDIANKNGKLVAEVIPPGKSKSLYGEAIPCGSYQSTCKNITVTLKAHCRKIDGSWVESTPLIYGTTVSMLFPKGIVNNNGVLTFV